MWRILTLERNPSVNQGNKNYLPSNVRKMKANVKLGGSCLWLFYCKNFEMSLKSDWLALLSPQWESSSAARNNVRIGFQPTLKSQPGRSVDGVDGGREAFQERQPSATGGEMQPVLVFLFSFFSSPSKKTTAVLQSTSSLAAGEAQQWQPGWFFK